jgi:hypothetical protein
MELPPVSVNAILRTFGRRLGEMETMQS